MNICIMDYDGQETCCKSFILDRAHATVHARKQDKSIKTRILTLNININININSTIYLCIYIYVE